MDTRRKKRPKPEGPGWTHVAAYRESIYQDGKKIQYVVLGNKRYELGNYPQQVEIWLREINETVTRSWEED